MQEDKGTPFGAPPDYSGTEATGKMGQAKEFVSEKLSATSEAVKDKYAQAKDKVGDTYSQVRNKVEDINYAEVSDQVRTYVRSNPGKALLISVAAGFLLGLVLRRGRDDDY